MVSFVLPPRLRRKPFHQGRRARWRSNAHRQRGQLMRWESPWICATSPLSPRIVLPMWDPPALWRRSPIFPKLSSVTQHEPGFPRRGYVRELDHLGLSLLSLKNTRIAYHPTVKQSLPLRVRGANTLPPAGCNARPPIDSAIQLPAGLRPLVELLPQAAESTQYAFLACSPSLPFSPLPPS